MNTPYTLFRKIFTLLLIFVFTGLNVVAQKTGIVLSGGGASGIAHIGFLKALEKAGIPIDYIGGTSIGAYIAGLYASGYSPNEIESMIKSEEFIRIAKGESDPEKAFYFKKQEDNASWLNLHFDLQSGLKNNLPVNFINSVPLDFKMMEVFMRPSTAANYNFDSLFIPCRCVASDISSKQSVVFRNGDLTEAVRASMTYPFYLRPITKNGKLLFDGGLYDNFPAQTINREFSPDIIIGCTVTENAPDPDEEDLYLQLRTMMMAKTNFNTDCENGIIINPYSAVGLFDFQNPQYLIDSGYAATVREMENIKLQVKRVVLPEEIDRKSTRLNSSHTDISRMPSSA